MRAITVGTRRSALALTQTEWVCEQLRRHYPQLVIHKKTIVTKGDRILDVTLSKVGGKGLFVKEIEGALLRGEIDFAVHSMKDLPAEMAEGLIIAAVPPREEAWDVLISRSGCPFQELPRGARVGTSSLRRGAQLKAARPDVQIVSLRGNIDTRLRKMEEEQLDAIVLAAAGLARMGWREKITERLSPSVCLPAVGQGALAVQCRADDLEMRELLAVLDHSPTRLAVTAERVLLARLNGGCQVPLAAYAEWVGGELQLAGFVGLPDGSRGIRQSASGQDPAEVGQRVYEGLLRQGAREILAAVKEEGEKDE